MREGDARRGDAGDRPRPRRRARAAAGLAGRDGCSAHPRRGDAAAAAPGRRAQPPRPVRRARRIHERKLARPSTSLVARPRRRPRRDLGRRATALFDACIPAIPYAAAAAFLGREKLKLTRADGDRPRVALVADGLGATHGVTRTVAPDPRARRPGLRGRGDRHRRRCRPPAERGRRDRDPVLRAGCRIGVPEPAGDRRGAGRRPLRPGPPLLPRPGRASAPGCWRGCCELPVIGSYHTELAAYAGLRSGAGAPRGDRRRGAAARFYGACDVVLSPSPATDAAAGRARHRVRRGSAAGTAASTSPASTPRLRDPTTVRRRGQRAVLPGG